MKQISFVVLAAVLLVAFVGFSSCELINWTQDQLFVDQVFTVKKSDSLVVGPGVKVTLKGNSYIQVYGTILVQGSMETRALFTSQVNTLVLEAGASANLQYAIFISETSNSICIQANNAGQLSVQDTFMHGNGGVGILSNNGTNVVIQNSLIDKMTLGLSINKGTLQLTSSSVTIQDRRMFAIAALYNSRVTITKTTVNGGVLTEGNSIVDISQSVVQNCQNCIRSLNENLMFSVTESNVTADITAFQITRSQPVPIVLADNIINVPKESADSYGIYISSTSDLSPIRVTGSVVNSRVYIKATGNHLVTITDNNFSVSQRNIIVQSNGVVTIIRNKFKGFKLAIDTTGSVPQSLTVSDNQFTEGFQAVQTSSVSSIATFSNNIVEFVSVAVNFTATASDSGLNVLYNKFIDCTCSFTQGLINLRALSKQATRINVLQNEFTSINAQSSNGVVVVKSDTTASSLINLSNNVFKDVLGTSASIDNRQEALIEVNLAQNIFMNPGTQYDLEINGVVKVPADASYNYWGFSDWKSVSSRVPDLATAKLSPFFLTADVTDYSSNNIGYSSSQHKGKSRRH